MQRLFPSLLLLPLLVAPARTAPLPAEQREVSTRFIHGLQNPDGGYRNADASGPSQLGATSSSLRALKYLDAKPRRREEIRKFVLSCYNPETGAFADTPGGTPDARTTAMGLMAMAELKMPVKKHEEKIRAYFTENARTVPDVYIATAAMDAAKLRSEAGGRWIARFDVMRNPDGTYGRGPVDTATAVITILRLGGSFPNREAVVQSIRGAQKSDGGFAAMGENSDLPTTYRMVRALSMLRERPDLARLREFVARCRNADGGYGTAPGQPSSAGGTYFAAIVQHWADELE